MLQLVHGEGSARLAVADDASEQSVWRHFYDAVHELPAGCAACVGS